MNNKTRLMCLFINGVTFTISAKDCQIINKILNLNFDTSFFNSKIFGK
jgi:hypothetical protein